MCSAMARVLRTCETLPCSSCGEQFLPWCQSVTRCRDCWRAFRIEVQQEARSFQMIPVEPVTPIANEGPGFLHHASPWPDMTWEELVDDNDLRRSEDQIHYGFTTRERQRLSALRRSPSFCAYLGRRHYTPPPSPPPPAYQFCRKCGEEKPITEYYPKPSAYTGYMSQCKVCSLAESRRWYRKHKQGEAR